MYESLRRSAKTAIEIDKEADRRVPKAKTPDERSRRDMLVESERVRLRIENDQLDRLVRKKLSDNDVRILAEATYLLGRYRTDYGPQFDLFLASNDSSHLVPVRAGYVSDKVTKEIRRRTGVTCAWPDEVLQALVEGSKSPTYAVAPDESESRFIPCPGCRSLVSWKFDECPLCGSEMYPL
jgi:hypothetical protein